MEDSRQGQGGREGRDKTWGRAFVDSSLALRKTAKQKGASLESNAIIGGRYRFLQVGGAQFSAGSTPILPIKASF